MKECSVALAAHLQGEVTSVIACVKLTLTKYQPRIAAITNTSPCIVTTRWPHHYPTGTVVKFYNIRGMTELNDQEYVVTYIDRLNFSIAVDATGFGEYTSKGEVRKVVGFTEFSRDLTVENVVYNSTLAYSVKSLKQGSDLSVDSIEHQGVLRNAAKDELEAVITADGISDEDLAAGRYDNCQVEIFIVNHEDLSMGKLVMPLGGRLGETTLHRGIYQAELSGMTAPLQEQLQEIYTRECRADLGDDLDGSEAYHQLRTGFGCKVKLDPPVWKGLTDYSVRPAGDAGLGAVVKPTWAAGRQFRCSVAGTSGDIEPAWDTTLGATNVDGSVTWITEEGLTKTGVVYQAIDRRRFIDDSRNEAPITGGAGTSALFPITAVNQGAKRFTIAGSLAANFPADARFDVVGSAGNDGQYTVVSVSQSGGNTLIVVSQSIPGSVAGGKIVGRLPALVGFFTFGKVTFTSGKNIGISREVKSFAVTPAGGGYGGPGYFELFEAAPFDIMLGDLYEVQAGCDKSLAMCVGRFDNVNNRRAEDNIPGMDAILLYPDAK